MLRITVFCAIILGAFGVGVLGNNCPGKKLSSKLICYFTKLEDADPCRCTHVILPQGTEKKTLDDARKKLNVVKLLITVNDFNEGIINTIKSTKIDGLEINLKKLTSKTDISDFISTVRSKLGPDLYLALSVPPKAEILAKYYDLKALTKQADVFILQTAFLGASNNVTFHPSRLSGLWDMQNTDSVVDLITGLGAPLSKLVITAPVQAFSFTLQNEEHTAPGSPALDVRSLNREELCNKMKDGKSWMLERDQDQAGPYIFREKEWIAFDDSTSMDIKAKYARVRGLSGIALKDVSQDGGEKCDGSLLEAAYNGLSRQGRAPRAAVLHSLEREILETPRPIDTIQVSPYRITRIIDVEGHVHIVRQDTRTEFECSRQGYFVHPRSCGRFHRCVKFDQLSDEFNVFEFDCPAGLVFDSKVEVCVWPGSLSHASACSGSSEIAPVPRQRFICPSEPGYYADPENCRWFFACLDHGKSPLSAYEFRCPFGLVFDESRLICEWPWLVPKCGSGTAEGELFGYEKGINQFPLSQYDGLGTLGIVPLGGLTGTITQPIQRVYSTVIGNIGFGLDNQINLVPISGFDANLGILQNHSQFGYYNAFGLNGVNDGNVLVQANIGGSNFGQGGQYVVNDKTGFRYESADKDASLNIIQNNADYINHGFSAIAQQQKYNKISPVTENINIVGGGYSAVGSVGLSGRSEIEITHEGSNIDTISSATPVTLQYPSGSPEANVPVVSSVPVPNGKLNELDTYNGGVIANLPQLQYKIDSANSYYQSNYFSKFANDTLFVNYVSSTPAPDYNYRNQEIAFVKNPIKIVSSTPAPFIVENSPKINIAQQVHGQQYSGFNAQKQTHFVSTTPTPAHVENLQPIVTDYSYPTSGQLINTGAVSTYSFNKVDNSPKQVVYETHKLIQPQPPIVSINTYSTPSTVKPIQPAIFEEVPHVVTTYATPKPIGNGYTYSKPTIKFEVTPAIVHSTPQPIFQPISTYSTPKTPIPAVNYGYYEYQKPVVAPVVVSTYSTPSTIRPIVSVQPTVATSYNYENQKHQGYVYQKPAVVFEEKPAIVSTYTTPTPVVVTHGYEYKKPSVVFEEKPAVVTYSTPKPIVVTQPTVAHSYSYENKEHAEQGYHYQKPTVAFEERPAIITTYSTPKPTVVTPAAFANSYNYGNKEHISVHQGYEYQKPAPVVVSTYSTPTTAKPAIAIASNVASGYSYGNKVDHGYGYQKPAIVFEERPAVVTTYSTPKPVIIQPVVAQSYNYENKEHAVQQGYEYQKPVVTFEEKPIVVSTYSTPSTVKPIVAVGTNVGSGYSYGSKVDHGYVYQKPAVVFEHKPAVVTTYSTPKPIAVQPVIAQSYNYENEERVIQQGYDYQKPEVTFEEKPIVVSSYSTPSTVKPTIAFDKNVASGYSYGSKVDHGYVYHKPSVIFEERPAVVTTYSTPKPTVVTQNYNYENKAQVTLQQGYEYQKPAIAFEQKQILSTYSKPSVAFESNVAAGYSYGSNVDHGYVYQKPEVVTTYTTPKPAVTQSYNYYNKQYDYQKPVVVSTPSTVESNVATGYSYGHKVDHGYVYQKPAVVFEEKPAVVTYSTPKPVTVVQPTIATTVINKGYSYPQPAVRFEEVSSHSTPKPTVGYTYGAAEHKQLYEEANKFAGSLEFKGYEYAKPQVAFVEAPKTVINYENRQPVYEEPFVAKKAYVTGERTASKPAVNPFTKYSQSVDTSNAYYINYNLGSSISTTPVYKEVYTTPTPVVYYSSTPKPTYQSTIASIYPSTQRYYESTTQSRPISKYSFSSFDDVYQFDSTPKTIVPTAAYVPVVQAKKVYVESTSERAYLPPKLKTVHYVEDYVAPGFEVSTPTNAYLPAQVRPKVIIKQNDFHPVLSAKLGAQCTCVSNTVNLRKKKPTEVIVDDEDEYYVKPQVLENYEYDAQRIVEVTSAPGVVYKSTTNAIIPVQAPNFVRKRVKVRPVTTPLYYEEPVTQAVEVFLRSKSKEEVSDGEIVDTVRKGLKLIKSAAKEGAKEAIEEEASKVRLQGAIDCQRAGLFRHPNQCNKFYSCRWDCNKKKFTLHVFNCPVHLTFDNTLGACNWPSQGPTCLENTLLPSD